MEAQARVEIEATAVIPCDTAALMGGRIAALALGRRTRWLVIGTWVVLAVVLAPLQPRLQTIASDESQTFFTRGADSTTVDRLLDTRFPEGGDATAVVAYVSNQGSIHTRTEDIARDVEALCATETLPTLKGVGGPDGAACGELGHVLGPETPPSAFSSDSPESMVLLSVVNGRDDTESVAADVAAIRALLPGPDGDPVRSYVTGAAGFDADRSAAVEGLDGTLLAITGVLVLVLMLVTYRSPLIAALMLGVVRDRLRDRDRHGLRPGEGRSDDRQRPVDGDPDRADVRRGHGLLPADRLALPRRAAALERRRGRDDPRGGADRAGDLRLRRDRRAVDARARAGGLQRDARDGAAAGARDRRDDGLRADAAAGAAGGVRAAARSGPRSRARRPSSGPAAAGRGSGGSSAAGRRC